jgi:hypothetical protein
MTTMRGTCRSCQRHSKASRGDLRNRVSREMFCQADIRQILANPRGRCLRPLEVAQSEPKQSVRTETTDGVAQLGKEGAAGGSIHRHGTQSAGHERVPLLLWPLSRRAEQKTINKLKINAAADSFTRQPFDCTIGQSIADAKGNNLTCPYKVRAPTWHFHYQHYVLSLACVAQAAPLLWEKTPGQLEAQLSSSESLVEQSWICQPHPSCIQSCPEAGLGPSHDPLRKLR